MHTHTHTHTNTYPHTQTHNIRFFSNLITEHQIMEGPTRRNLVFSNQIVIGPDARENINNKDTYYDKIDNS